MTEPSHIHQAEMGFTRKELVRGLTNAVVPYIITNSNANPIEITGSGHTALLSMSDPKTRSIGSARIPYIEVTIEFYDFNEVQFTEFMQRFRRYLHKGGG